MVRPASPSANADQGQTEPLASRVVPHARREPSTIRRVVIPKVVSGAHADLDTQERATFAQEVKKISDRNVLLAMRTLIEEEQRTSGLDPWIRTSNVYALSFIRDRLEQLEAQSVLDSPMSQAVTSPLADVTVGPALSGPPPPRVPPPRVPPPLPSSSQPKGRLADKKFGTTMSAAELAAKMQQAHETKTEDRRPEREILRDEIGRVNEELAKTGLKYRVHSLADLEEAKKAANEVGYTRPVQDMKRLIADLVRALRLGALGGVDESLEEKQRFVRDVVGHVLELAPSLSTLFAEAKPITFDTVNSWGLAINDREAWRWQPKELATRAVAKRGSGLLQGLFPGEQLWAKPEEAGPDRTQAMLQLGTALVKSLKMVGNIRPELTGSLVLSQGGYKPLPADVDINVTLPQDDASRLDLWMKVQKVFKAFESCDVTLSGETMKMTALTGVEENTARILERRYAYPMKYRGMADRISVVEVEIKDVGSSVWHEHIASTAPERTTDALGLSDPRWIVVDTLKRIISHRSEMRDELGKPDTSDERLRDLSESARKGVWRDIIIKNGIGAANDKHLREKVQVGLAMTRLSLGEYRDWLKTVLVDEKRFGEFAELLTSCRSEQEFVDWLSKI